MNKSKIEWCDYTWNPVTGCLNGCDYCYARRIAERFAGESFKKYKHHYAEDCKHVLEIAQYDSKGKKESFPSGFQPTFHKYRLDEPKEIKKPSRIFVCSMADLFGEWVPDEWIQAVLKTVKECPQHTFIFLTKNPSGAKYIDFPDNAWVGVSLENQKMANAKLLHFAFVRAKTKWLSLEPLLGDIRLDRVEPNNNAIMDVLEGMAYWLGGGQKHMKINWVVVGGQTGPKAVKPDAIWIESLIKQCKTFKTPLFLKNNLNWPEKIQEFPEVKENANRLRQV